MKVDVLVCFPDIIVSRFVTSTLLPVTHQPVVSRVLARVGMRSEYAREVLLEEFMRGDSDFVFIIDADMEIPSNALPKLLGHRKRFITGLYFSRGDMAFPTIFQTEPIDQWPKTRYFYYPDNQLIKVGACGHGCLLIHRSVLASMERPWSQLGPFRDQPLVGSDLRLCLKARTEAKVNIWCDTSIKCGHIRPQSITERDWVENREEGIRAWEEQKDEK